MKFTLSWLKEHLDTAASLDQIVETLTKIGLEVESVEDKGKALSNFTIAHIVSAEQHPNADKLRVCMVDTGDGVPLQVVCGAPNARAGLKTVFSPPGTYIPAKKITIAKGVIRGVESNGMMCSFGELDLPETSDGIIELAPDAPTGTRYADYAELSDPVIEINLTPNRPDCTSIHGIARDLAAAGLGDVKTPAHKPVVGVGACPVAVQIALNAPDNCPLFALRLVRGVKNCASPEWLQKRLKSIGLRPINGLVDITNFLTHDRGRPLHVFDAAKVTGKLIVREAVEGETLLALDGRDYVLSASMTVIADETGVISLAGIMGGQSTGVDETTTDVLIESALWSPENIARTGRTLGINSDARYRFERGIDPAFTLPGLELATQLVLDLCGGEASQNEIAGALPEDTRIIHFPVAEVARLTGADVPEYEIKVILQQLGFWLSGTNHEVWAVSPPSWRPDVSCKADLVEEVIRIAGVERVPSTPLPRNGQVMEPVLTLLQKRTRLAKRTLALRGMMEAVTWSFLPKAQALHFGGGQDALDLANPISVELTSMRPSLLAGLLAALGRNGDRGFDDVALFEVGQVFKGAEPGEQMITASGVRRGLAKMGFGARHWAQATCSVDAFDAKDDILAVLAELGAPIESLNVTNDAPSWYHPGRSGTLRLGPKILGYFGELHPKTLDVMKLDAPVVGFEVMLEHLPTPKQRATRTKPLADMTALQPVHRDFAFIVQADVAASDVLKAAKGADKVLVSTVNIFDLYEGKGVEEGKKSLAIEVTLQPREKTLTDTDIEAVAAKIIAAVQKSTGGVLRG